MEMNKISACDTKQLERVAARIPNDRIVAIEEMGFGCVLGWRGIEVNPSLCKMLVENFDVKNSTINIHGRNLSITYKDFHRVMGVKCWGTIVDTNSSTKELEINHWKKQLCGVDGDISLQQLRHMVVGTYNDEELWMVCFALFMLSTVLCPSRLGYVDMSLLVPLTHPTAIRKHNWAEFGYRKMVDGVRMYQSCESTYVEGCVLFLQLFYLTVLRERTCLFPTMPLPVRSWDEKMCCRMYERVEELGGFYAPKGVWVSKRYMGTGSTDFGGSYDSSTGLKANVVDDMADLRSDMNYIQQLIVKLQSAVCVLGPEILQLREALCTLKGSACKELSEDEITVLVRKVNEAVVAKGGGCLRADDMGDDLGVEQSPNREMRQGYDEANKDADDRTQPLKKPGGRKYHGIADLSAKESDLLSYLFSRKGRSEGILESDEIGRYGLYSVTRWDLKCLSAKQSISSEIINIMGGYSVGSSRTFWFLPTYFAERAVEFSSGHNKESHISSTITVCGLRTLKGQLHECSNIFIPVEDVAADHWFLVVLKVQDGECEIWDSVPDPRVEQRRLGYAHSCINFVAKVFQGDIRCDPILVKKFASFSVIYPEDNPTQIHNYDSGIFTIRNIQYYRECWYEGFNSGDQRVRLGLEIVNHPLNDRAKSVWDSVYRELKEKINDTGVVTSSIPAGGIKFKPRVARRN
ncbi:uncharacterized protein LOC126782250 isoform X2 [Argentina anserina]|nr:uncharacterized protein LOC126782250 isoform X2 [Potentilla anserina]